MRDKRPRKRLEKLSLDLHSSESRISLGAVCKSAKVYKSPINIE
jgi:hypothetical protein